MIFAALVGQLLAAWFLPWWMTALTAFILGWICHGWGMRFPALQVSLAGALSWATSAYVQDGRSHGLISERMAALFGLPSSPLIFVVMGFLGLVTTLLAFQSAATLRDFTARKSV